MRLPAVSPRTRASILACRAVPASAPAAANPATNETSTTMRGRRRRVGSIRARRYGIFGAQSAEVSPERSSSPAAAATNAYVTSSGCFFRPSREPRLR